MKKHLATFVFVLTALILFSQNQEETDTLELSISIQDLSAVTITAYRLEELESEVPLAVSRIGLNQLERGEQQLTLNDALASVPGLYAQNAENFAQDLRVSIRGFGARSAFGIRGVKVMMDGFPETTPDGTGQVDNIDPGALRSVEVIRGQTAGLYGNASGGYMNLTTLDFSGNEYLETGFRFGSFGLQKFNLKSVGKMGKFKYSIFGSALNREGYRENSETESYLFNSGFQYAFDSTTTLTLALNYVDSPEANEPGNLNLEQVEEDPTQARNATWGEEVRQGRLGIHLKKKWGERDEVSIRGFHTQRDFQNILFGRINDLNRSFTGAQATWNHDFKSPKLPWKFAFGSGIEYQLDERESFEYDDGEKGEPLDKRLEEYTNAYFFGSTKMTLFEFVHLHYGIRYDHIQIGLENEFLASLRGVEVKDKTTYNELNHMFGASLSFDPKFSLYFNLSSAFETPTLRESISIGADQLDPNLSPQEADTKEIGIKGWLGKGTFQYGLSIFQIKTKDEIVAIEVIEDDFEFANVGLTDRKGLELSLGYRLAKNLYGYTSYTWSNFTFLQDERPESASMVGEHLPGIPLNLFWSELRYQPETGFFAIAKSRHVGKQYADSENSVKIAPFWLVDFRIGFAWKKNKLRGELFGGMNNIFDKSYYSNLRINDGFGRYYEPAPGRNFVVGLSFRFDS